MTEPGDTPTAPESPFGPPPAEAHVDPSPPAQTAPPAKSGNKAVLVIVAVIAVIAVVAAAVFFVLHRKAVDDSNTAENDLAAVEAALVESEQAASQAEAQLESTEQQLAAAEASLADANTASTDKDAELARAQSDLAAAQAALAESEANFAESQDAVERYKVATIDFLALSIETGTGADEAAAQCVAEAIVESVGPGALELLIGAAQGESDGTTQLGAEMLAAAPGCGLPDDFFDDSSAFAYGDDPALDALYDECAGGSGAACDQLYVDSAVGSDYEAFAVTCGERFTLEEAPALCEGAI